MIKDITENSFEDNQLRVEGLAIVECYKGALSPLQIMDPVLYRLRTENKYKFSHLRADIKKYSFIVGEFHVLTFPSYLFFYNGVLIDRLEGLVSFNDLSKAIDDNFSNINLKPI